MRTISALIAATYCALALSTSAIAKEGDRSPIQNSTSGWLEFRAVVAAEDLWPKKVGIRRAELVEAPMAQHKDADASVAAVDAIAPAIGSGLDSLGQWSALANWKVTDFDVARN